MDVDLGFDGCGFGVLKGIWVEMKKKKRKKMKKKKVRQLVDLTRASPSQS